jgi:MFS transporter, SET family, sugar efflux transporter
MPGSLPFVPVLRDPMLRAIAALMLIWGAVICSFGPYVSVLAVKTFGLGDRGYAVLLVSASLVSVSAALWAGIRADQTANRRAMALRTLGILLAGLALMTLRPTALSFVLVHAVMIPLASSLWGQLFALARLAASVQPAETRDGIMTTIRALFALPFIVVLPIWSVAYSHGTSLLMVYPVCLALAAGMGLLTLLCWPRDGQTAWTDPPSGLSFRAALAELAHPAVALRVLALGAVNGATTIYIAILALVMGPAVGRGAPDVALYFGGVAGLEVPLMLMLPMVSRFFRRTTLILAGTVLYCVHVVGLPLLAGTAYVWLLILPAALGGAAVLTLPIAYMQEMLASRPGTGAALMALQVLAGQVVAAGCFAIGTGLSGYGLVAFLGSACAVAGAVSLYLADRHQA